MAQLIVFEGIDGSGKTTLSKLFHARLADGGTPAVWLREPTDSPSGNRIRQIARSKRSLPLEEELAYFIEDRKWDVRTNIIPALRAGRTVVMDRYFYSNACYQGARGLDMGVIIEMNRAFAPDADIVFLIDIDPDTALARIRRTNRGRALLFEKRSFLEKVRRNYLSLGQWVPRLHVIDGKADVPVVFERVNTAYREAAAAVQP